MSKNALLVKLDTRTLVFQTVLHNSSTKTTNKIVNHVIANAKNVLVQLLMNVKLVLLQMLCCQPLVLMIVVLLNSIILILILVMIVFLIVKTVLIPRLVLLVLLLTIIDHQIKVVLKTVVLDSLMTIMMVLVLLVTLPVIPARELLILNVLKTHVHQVTSNQLNLQLHAYLIVLLNNSIIITPKLAKTVVLIVMNAHLLLNVLLVTAQLTNTKEPVLLIVLRTSSNPNPEPKNVKHATPDANNAPQETTTQLAQTVTLDTSSKSTPALSNVLEAK